MLLALQSHDALKWTSERQNYLVLQYLENGLFISFLESPVYTDYILPHVSH